MSTTKKRAAPAKPTTAAPAKAKKPRRVRASLTEPHPDAAAITESMKGDAVLDKARVYKAYTHAWLKTSCFEKTLDFYVRKLGFRLLFRHAKQWAEVGGPGGLVLGFQPGKRQPKSGMTITVGTLDHEASVAALRERGVFVQDEVKHQGPVTLRTLTDPAGYEINLVAAAPPKPAANGAATNGAGAGAGAGGDEQEDPSTDDAADSGAARLYEADKELRFSDYGNIKLESSDLDATAAFYCQQLGFKQVSRFGDMWLEVESPGRFRLGFLRSDTAKTVPKAGWFLGFGSGNLCKTRNAAVAAGVKTFAPVMEEEGGGYMATQHFTDPDGVPLAIVAEATAKGDLTEVHHDCLDIRTVRGAPWGDEPLKYHNDTTVWLECASVNATAEFYVRTLAWKLVARYGDDWLEVMAPGNVVVGFQPYAEGASRSKDKGVAITVGVLDLKKTTAALKKRGVTTFAPTLENKGMVVLQGFTDPDGHGLKLIGMAAKGKAPKGKGKGKASKAKATADAGADEAKAEGGAKDESKDEAKADAGAPTGGGETENPMTPWVGGDPSLGYNNYGNITLCSTDLDKTQAFWRDVLGFKVGSRWENMWLEMVAPGGVRVGFEANPEAAKWTKADYDVAFGTSDMAATKAALASRGVTTFADSTVKVGPCDLLRFTDPEGNRLMLCFVNPHGGEDKNAGDATA